MRSLRELGREYIWGIHEPEKTKIVLGSEAEKHSKRKNLEALSPDMLRKIVLREPLLYGGICKKNKDTIRNWIKIKPRNEDGKVPQRDADIIHDFERRTNFPMKLETAGKCANIYGNGYIEIGFLEDENNTIESPVPEDAEPVSLNLINAELINDFGPMEKDKGKKNAQKYYIMKDLKGKITYIHPDRLIDISIDKLPFSYMGVSKVHIALNILDSKMNADKSSGEILSWFGHGIPALTVQNMTNDQKKKAIEYFKTHPDYFVFDQDYTMEMHNPTRIDPAPFYEYFYVNIARTLEMPTHMLTGIQPGEVTGSEVGLSDYYHDIENIQKIVFTPTIEEIYTKLLKSKGRKWKYKIVWNPIFVDEMSEAKIMEKRTLAATQLKAHSIVDLPESRRIMNDGFVFLDPTKKIEDKQIGGVPPAIPNLNPSKAKPNEKPTPLKPVPLNDEQKEMIRKCREKGIIESLQQEERLREAEEKLKKRFKHDL